MTGKENSGHTRYLHNYCLVCAHPPTHAVMETQVLLNGAHVANTTWVRVNMLLSHHILPE